MNNNTIVKNINPTIKIFTFSDLHADIHVLIILLSNMISIMSSREKSIFLIFLLLTKIKNLKKQ